MVNISLYSFMDIMLEIVIKCKRNMMFKQLENLYKLQVTRIKPTSLVKKTKKRTKCLMSIMPGIIFHNEA